jgi:hypothetical protein
MAITVIVVAHGGMRQGNISHVIVVLMPPGRMAVCVAIINMGMDSMTGVAVSWRTSTMVVTAASTCMHRSLCIRGHYNLGGKRGDGDHEREQR